jgi:glycosyl transferase family 1
LFGGADVEVTLYLDTDQDLYHTSYVYAGIFGLAAHSDLELELRAPTLGTWRKTGLGSTYVSLDVRAPDGTVLPLAIDLRDRSDLFDESALKNVAVYFKRSHHLADVAKLPSALREKVLPFGMNFVCGNVPSAKAVSAQILRHIASKIARRTDGSGTVESLMRKVYDYWGYRRESDYTAAPDTPKTAAVLFQTRIWEDHEALGDDPNAINGQRVRLVRALKQALGERFCGGLVPTALALRRYPELVTARPVSPAAYARWQRGILIGVYTRGLHYSTAWKLGEYFAASMCVVAEPPRNQLPVPINEGVEFLAFDSPDECIAACESVLSNPGLQRTMRTAAHDYYQREVAPMAHLRSCLARAIARHELAVAGP